MSYHSSGILQLTSKVVGPQSTVDGSRYLRWRLRKGVMDEVTEFWCQDLGFFAMKSR